MNQALFFYINFNIFFDISLAIGLYCLKGFVSQEGIIKAAGGTSFDALKNLISSSQIRSIGLYMYLMDRNDDHSLGYFN
jgi:hypothetical protein